ncbi:hypothetical protein T492DRAFT_229680 [Pavlovales sp. CCMP2436]|nr:hypothetical protein T492DRAFT_229680 [Pavlovales sp. CCMP2436]|mmetsp:Transcript_19340/g.49159  ORF Transcript_19340/g.49159 Transcript_19340/m.49159 type:complete len:227 (-) Transcript_19340:216-896(-)|eukprot:CAMPEP_0179869372 /NCGR_PEP_ID=MMETSP0982-20121206/19487_1 /TAXON_ID=483367 /ORGANISM="non described non described, Strain CCMP 2436" /LENGTH=226 /DNA_ID=CAMNT_0021759431 /DNA_START=38 /DNA_END=718 /DNA_ORIENTATION=-
MVAVPRRAIVLAAVFAAASLAALVSLTFSGATIAPANGTMDSCQADACGSSEASPDSCKFDPRCAVCDWEGSPDGANKPVGCAFCAGGKCSNKLPGGALTEDPNDCQSGELLADGDGGSDGGSGSYCNSCIAEGCGTYENLPADPGVCAWNTQPDGRFKPVGCSYCTGGTCKNKKANGMQATSSSKCQTGKTDCTKYPYICGADEINCATTSTSESTLPDALQYQG